MLSIKFLKSILAENVETLGPWRLSDIVKLEFLSNQFPGNILPLV